MARKIEGWVTDPFGKRRDWYDVDCESIHPSAVVDRATLVIGDERVFAESEVMRLLLKIRNEYYAIEDTKFLDRLAKDELGITLDPA